jgi:hypothetical protein
MVSRKKGYSPRRIWYGHLPRIIYSTIRNRGAIYGTIRNRGTHLQCYTGVGGGGGAAPLKSDIPHQEPESSFPWAGRGS